MAFLFKGLLVFTYFSDLFGKGNSQNLVQANIDAYERSLIQAETQALMSIKMVEFYKDAIKKLNTYKTPQI